MVSFNLPTRRCEGGSIMIPIFQVKTCRLRFINNLGSHCYKVLAKEIQTVVCLNHEAGISV